MIPKTKKFFSLLLCMMAIHSWAGDFQLNGINYKKGVNQTAMVMAVDESGDGEFGNHNGYVGDIVIPETVTYEDVTYTVTAIDEEAFVGCSLLTSISLPSTIENVGSSPFLACNSLSSIQVNPSNTHYCSVDGVLFDKSLTTLITCPAMRKGSYSIPQTVTNINAAAFYGCSQLIEVNIPSSVSEMGSSAFRDCSNLVSLSLPNGMENLPPSAFFGCTKLKMVMLPSTLKTIGANAFFNCSALYYIPFPASLTAIHSKAFSGCSSLSSVTLPANLEVIAAQAFENCLISTIVIPAKVSSIEPLAFANCHSLRSILVVNENEEYMSMNGVVYSKDASVLICYPNGKQGSFTLPVTVTRLADCSMAYSNLLTDVKLPSSLTQIGNMALFGCSGLKRIVVPSGVTRIGLSAFNYCSSLQSVICYSGAVPSLSGDAFTSAMYASVKLYVPQKLLAKYKSTARWKKFSSILPIAEYLSSESEQAFVNAPTSFTLSMVNADTKINSYEFDLVLPEGVTLLKNVVDYRLECAPARHGGILPTILVDERTQGVYHVTVTMSEDAVFSENEGELLKAYVMVGNVTEGNLWGRVDSMTLHCVDGSSTSIDGCDVWLEVTDWLIGDVNMDGEVSVVDVMLVVESIMGQRPANMTWQLGDVNGDGNINVSDVMLIVEKIMTH